MKHEPNSGCCPEHEYRGLEVFVSCFVCGELSPPFANIDDAESWRIAHFAEYHDE